MKRVVVLLSFVLTVVGVLGIGSRAFAVKQFKDAFEAKYVKPQGSAAEEIALKKAVETAKCAICHAGETKKVRNAYGAELGKLLDRKKDKDDRAKIEAALEKVAAVKSNAKDPKSPTFGELIRQGKLPCPAR